MTSSTATAFEERVAEIPADHREVLARLWDFYLQNGRWPDAVVFRKKVGRPLVKQVVDTEGPTFVQLVNDPPNEDCYRLTLEGVFAVEGWDGKHVRMLCAFLNYLKFKFNENPKLDSVTATQAGGTLELSDGDLRVLGELLAIGTPPVYSTSSRLDSSNWKLGFERDKDQLEKLDDADNPREYLLVEWNGKLQRGQYYSRSIETLIREYLRSGDFQRRYPAAYQKWSEAEHMLWQRDSNQFTTIGHLCREAMQEFTTRLVERFQPAEVDPDRAHVVARVRAILKWRAANGTIREFLDALLAYWGTVSDLVQRQEHGAQKEGALLRWDDARRVVFHTLVVMFEVDKFLAGGM